MAKCLEVHEPFSGERWGHLKVTGGLANGLVSATEPVPPEPPPFASGCFEGAIPQVHRDGCDLYIAYPRWAGWGRPPRARLGLSPAIPWSIAIHGGVAGLSVQLAQVRLVECSILGGVSGVTLCLPRPSERVSLRISGGVSHLTVLRPAGTGMRLRVSGGASAVRLDETSLSSVGGGLAWQSDRDLGSSYYDLEILGGAANLGIGRGLREELCHAGGPRPGSAAPSSPESAATPA